MAMFTGLGAAILAALGAAAPATAAGAAVVGTAAAAGIAGAAGIGIAAAAKGIGSMAKGTQMPESSALGLPKSVTESASETISKATTQAKAATQARQVAARRSRSIFSSPLGISGEATTAKKYLLGQ